MRTILVFANPAMNVQSNSSSFSPSAGKPQRLFSYWQDNYVPITYEWSEPVTPAQLRLAHDPDYVRGVLNLERSNGFGNKNPDVAISLPYTTGAFLDAAREALDRGVACAPVSGFHHAGYDFGGGFCTFNGLMVTACQLKADARVKKIAILDLDMHYGNGTQDIIDRLDAKSWVQHWSNSMYPHEAEAFLDGLPAIIQNFGDIDLLMYQAGADSHVDDPLGGYLTTEQMRRRDKIVFTECKRLGIPVVWNLAGGYQQTSDGGIDAVLKLHHATMEECVKVYVTAEAY